MKLRSLLFVPGDSQRKFEKAACSGADVLILDLEDSVAPTHKAAARGIVAKLVDSRDRRDWSFFVRVNPLHSGLILDDLVAVVRPGLDGLMIPKMESAQEVERVACYLDALEARAGMPVGSVKLSIVATETAKAMFALHSYAPANPRLAALTWGGEDLAAALGATANRDEDGDWTFPYQVARAQCLFAASAANVAAIDTVYVDYRDAAGFERDCQRSRRDGFVGRMAIHPSQIAVTNRLYAPSEAEMERARKIVAAFEANPGAGTLGIDGKMVDVPHLKAAQKILASQ